MAMWTNMSDDPHTKLTNLVRNQPVGYYHQQQISLFISINQPESW